MANAQHDIEKTLDLGKKRRSFPKWLVGLVLLVAAGGGGFWWMSEAEERNKVEYVTETVATGDLTITVTATGSIEPTHVVSISSELSGTLKEVLVDYNDPVTQGQVLARLDTTQLDARLAVQKASFSAAKAQLANAKASQKEAELNYDTISQLDARGVTSHSNMIAAQAQLDRAIAGVAAAEAQLELAKANLEAQEAENAKATIHSPINGVVLAREYDPGQIVAASLQAPELFSIAEDLTQMELQVDVAEADIGKIKVGDTATFTVDAYDEQSFPARILLIRYASDTTDGLVTYKAILSVANDDLLLRPGMTATADITVAQHNNVLLVPNAALRFAPPQVIEQESEGEGRSGLLGLMMPRRPSGERVTSTRTVWVMRGDIATEIAVGKGDSDGQFTVVKSGDLQEGDLVVVDMFEGK